MKLVVTMRVLPKIYFSGAENRFSAHTAVRAIFGGHFPWERYFFFFVQNFFPGTIFFSSAFHVYLSSPVSVMLCVFVWEMPGGAFETSVCTFNALNCTGSHCKE